jgi:hypothetical protein
MVYSWKIIEEKKMITLGAFCLCTWLMAGAIGVSGNLGIIVMIPIYLFSLSVSLVADITIIRSIKKWLKMIGMIIGIQ